MSKQYAFNPDRFVKDGVLDPDILNPEVAAFGFGRRICPGRFMAHDSVWMLIACILAVFDVQPMVCLPFSYYIERCVTDTVPCSVPKTFKCDITSRSGRHRALVM